MALCQQFHERVAQGGKEFLAEAGRHTYVTPTSYLELLACFKGLQEAKRADNARLCKRWGAGPGQGRWPGLGGGGAGSGWDVAAAAAGGGACSTAAGRLASQ
jgi:hypothetical protein